MVDINLLPWREAKKLQDDKRLKWILMLSFIFLASILMSVHYIMLRQQQHLMKKIVRLTIQQKFVAMHELAKSPSITFSVNELQALQDDRLATKQLLLKIGELSTKKVCFTEVSRREHAIIFSGKSNSTIDLATFLMHWDAFYLFSEAKLEHLSKNEKDNLIIFRLQATDRHASLFLKNKNEEKC